MGHSDINEERRWASGEFYLPQLYANARAVYGLSVDQAKRHSGQYIQCGDSQLQGQICDI